MECDWGKREKDGYLDFFGGYFVLGPPSGLYFTKTGGGHLTQKIVSGWHGRHQDRNLFKGNRSVGIDGIFGKNPF